MRRTPTLFTVALFSLALIGVAKAEDSTGTALTVYSSADPASFDPQQFISQQSQGYNPTAAWQVPGFGVVKEIRSIDLQSGSNELRFTDVAQFIDPTTVSFVDLSDPKTSVSEQNFQFDLANSEKILQRYVDKEVSVSVQKGDSAEEIRGTLVSAAGNEIVLRTPGGIQLLSRSGPQIKLGDLPGGLITKPTLVWKVSSATPGKHKIRTTYQTAGITWRSDYNLILNGQDTAADLNAWVTLMNLSGSSYQNAALKLIAGDVQRVRPSSSRYEKNARSLMAVQDAAPEGFQEKSFFEYHLYSLPHRIDVLSNSTQQLTLFPTAKDLKVEKILLYNGLPDGFYWNNSDSPQTDRNFGNSSNKKLDVYIRFENKENNKMGMPLPAGKVRVYKLDDADGSLEFIGEDLIDHTARDEKVLIKLGQSFDVVGERTQTNYSIDVNAHRITESFKIQLRNHKDVAQKVVIKEALYRWASWEISAKSDPFEKVDARTVNFNVDVPARGEKTVTYTVKYSW
ncbi:MAG: DUF4139 domain-containing protein [Deltaproteobacteria bacterium]|nr:DUF4139 domain-containing protein [Deltaproteobacteria bacterium]